MSNSIEVLMTIIQFLPKEYKSKVITSSKILPGINLLTDVPDLDNITVCNSFTKDNFKILMKNTNLDRQKLFNCVVIRSLSIYVEILLKDKRVDPSDKNNQAIRFASYYGNPRIVKLLLKDSRVDPSDENN